jgi:hypothetical protein
MSQVQVYKYNFRNKLSADMSGRVQFTIVALAILILAMISAAYMNLIARERTERLARLKPEELMSSELNMAHVNVEVMVYYETLNAIFDASLMNDMSLENINKLFDSYFHEFIRRNYPTRVGDLVILVDAYEINISIVSSTPILLYTVHGEISYTVNNVKSGLYLSKVLTVSKTIEYTSEFTTVYPFLSA